MKLNKLIGSVFIFAASLTIIGLFGATASFAQNKENVKEEIEAGNVPTRIQLLQFCDDIYIGIPPQVQGYAPIGVKFSYNYEYRFWKLAGVDPAKDTEETGVLKVKKWLNKNSRNMICDDNRSFPLPNGGILKYAIHHNFPQMIDAFMITYEADVNFRDYVDGKTFLDFIDDEIIKTDPTGRKPNESTRTLKSYRMKYRTLGARTSAEVIKEIGWTAEDFLKAANDLMTQRDWGVADYYYSKAIELKPNNIEAYKSRAILRCKYIDESKAADDEKKVIELGGKLTEKCQ